MGSLTVQPHHEQMVPRNFPSSELSSTIYNWIAAQCQQCEVHDSPDGLRGPIKRENSPQGHACINEGSMLLTSKNLIVIK